MRLRRLRVVETRRVRMGDELLTDELLDDIVNSRTPDAFLECAPDVALDLPGFLNRELEKRGMRKAQVIRAANINETHGYQIFSGGRRASRNKVLALAFALGLDMRDTQRLLVHADVGALYYKNRRDAIITFCISHGHDLNRCDAELYRYGEETISDSGDD